MDNRDKLFIHSEGKTPCIYKQLVISFFVYPFIATVMQCLQLEFKAQACLRHFEAECSRDLCIPQGTLLGAAIAWESHSLDFEPQIAVQLQTNEFILPRVNFLV